MARRFLLAGRAASIAAAVLALSSPGVPTAAQTTPGPTSPAQPSPPVGVAPLAAPDQFSLGGSGPGLGADLWAGSSGAIVRAVIPALTSRTLSPAATALARQVLSTGAQGPQGVGDDPAMQGARLAALLALGDAPMVAAIADRSGSALARSETASRAAAEAELTLGRADAACAVGAALQSGRDGVYWLQLRSFCLALAGKTGEAQLAYDLANQQAGRATGTRGGFQRLMGVRLAGSGDAGPASAEDGLQYALSRSLKLELAPAMADAPLAVQAAAAQDASVGPAARLTAAAYAMRRSLIPRDVARAAYAGGAAALAATAPTPASQRAAPKTQPGGARGRRRSAIAAERAPSGLDVRAEAGRYAALLAAPDPAAKAAALEDLLRHAEDAAAFSALARLAQPEYFALAPTAPVGERGRLFALAAASAEDPAIARAYRDKLARDGPNAVSAADLALLDAAIAAASGGIPGGVLDQLVAAAGGDPRRAAAAAAILTGLNNLRSQPPAGETRASLAFADIGPSAAGSARLLAMDAAADAALKGDTALLALSAAGAMGSGGQTPADRGRIVRALVKTGLPQPAALFALEGLIELQRR